MWWCTSCLYCQLISAWTVIRVVKNLITLVKDNHPDSSLQSRNRYWGAYWKSSHEKGYSYLKSSHGKGTGSGVRAVHLKT